MKLRRFLSVGIALVAVAFGAQANAATVTFAFFGGPSASMRIPDDDPMIHGAMTNGRWTVTGPSADIVGVTSSHGEEISRNSFETARNITPVPDLPTWAMVGLGFAGLVFAGYRSRRTPISIE